MFLGITLEKLLVIGVIAALLIGPERLPRFAETLASWTKRAREFMRQAQTRMKDELGPDFDDVDWRTLDPRQYDPRRIIKQALLEDDPTPTVKAAQAAAVVSAMTPAPPSMLKAGDAPPFDSEAT